MSRADVVRSDGEDQSNRAPLCPSAQPEMSGAVVFGVVGGTSSNPILAYLNEPLPVSDDLLRLCAPVEPGEVFRFAATCAGSGCMHFDGQSCSLAARITAALPGIVSVLPRCTIRHRCRWWDEQGGEACRRCPGIVTERYAPPEEMVIAAAPHVFGG